MTVESATWEAGAPWPVAATLDGRLVGHQRLLYPDDVGVLRGDGCFEATLVVDGVPRDLDEHLARFAVSARMLGIELPPVTDWLRGINAVIAAWARSGGAGSEMALRLVCTRGREHGGDPTAFVLGTAPSSHVAQERVDGIRVLLLSRGVVGSEVAAMPWLLAGAKTLSYAVNMAAKRYADAQHADDVIFVGSDGQILEGPTSSVVIARGRTLLTPPNDGILAGITVRRLFRDAAAADWATEVAPLTAPDLDRSDGVWLLSGVRLLSPVISIDGVDRPIGAAHRELAGILQVPGY